MQEWRKKLRKNRKFISIPLKEEVGHIGEGIQEEEKRKVNIFVRMGRKNGDSEKEVT